MNTVYSASTISLVSIFKNILEGHGISCRVTNEFLASGMGEIPPIECWPQLCVDDDDFVEAKRIIDEALSEKDPSPWRCESCSEDIEEQFTECWKCGKSRPA
jgi:hypothetical protein